MTTTLHIPPAFRLTLPLTDTLAEDSPAVDIPGLKLGQAANLLLGFKPDWTASDRATSPFFAPATEPLPTSTATVRHDPTAIWALPSITLHDNTNSLLSAVFPYDVQALTGDTSAFSIPSGPLIARDLDSANTLKKLSEYLGVDLLAGYQYMLVEQVRVCGTASANYVAGSGGAAGEHLSPEALAAVTKLKGVAKDSDSLGRLSAASSGEFIASFQSLGTHYVSKITAGDRVFQVFAYEAEPFVKLKAAFTESAQGKASVGGLSALPFVYYTSPRSSDTGVELGWVSGLGAVRIVSGDATFAASLQKGEWLDSKRAGGNSIFSASQQETKIDLEAFHSVVPIRFTMTPIGDLIPVMQNCAGRNYWNRILKGSFLQKYGQQVRVTFQPSTSGQWQNTIPNSGPWMSTIATPTANVYDSHLKLNKIQLTNRDAVRQFDSWSVILEGSGTAKIPGDQVSVSSFLIHTSGADAAPVMELSSKAALDGISLACGRMDGALTISYSGGPEHKVVMDGILLEAAGAVGSTGRGGVKVTGDLFGKLDATRLQGQINNLNFTIVTCQALLNASGPGADNAQALARECLNWTAAIIPDDESVSQELAVIRLRAAYMANVAGRLDQLGVTVPYLTYNNYSAYIAAMSTAAQTLNTTIFQYETKIAIQRNAELSAANAQQINENIKTSGKLLTDYIQAVATNQGDIAANYQGIIETKQRELQSAISGFADLAKSVSTQQEAVKQAKWDFEEAMSAYETGEIIKAVLNISVAFLTVGASIVTPSNTIKALESLGETAQKIQKLVTVLKNIMDLEKVIESTVRNIMAVNRTLTALESVKLSMPTSQEWSEMSINFDASLASVPSEVAGPKAKFVAAFKILVLRAQAMLAAQSKIAQLNADIALNKAQEKINQDQQQRLAQLTNGLHLGDTSKAPDQSEVDLLSLTGVVQSRLNQVLGTLAQAMAIQSSAVQFELLAKPTSIVQFDLINLQQMIATQQANIINAKNAFNPPPFVVNDPIQVFVKGVPISAFTGGNTYQFQIQPSESAFQPYNMVRVKQVTVDIPAIKASESGEYRIDLAFLGKPFEDRDPYGNPLVFNTVTRNFGPFGYKAADHKPLYGNDVGSIGADITRITPFSTWQVRMPRLPVNDGVDFGTEPGVDIVLSFHIEALAQPALLTAMRKRNISMATLTHADLMNAIRPSRMLAAGVGAVAAEAPAAASDASLDAMLTQMFKAEGVLKGWDCVLNMLEEPVNKFLKAQYDAKYPSATPMTVSVGFCQTFPNPEGDGTLLAYTRVSVDLGPPCLEFQTNNHNYVLVTQVIQKGYSQKGSKIVPEDDAKCPSPLNLDDPTIKWRDKKPINLGNKPELRGSVGLNMVEGKVTPKLPNGQNGKPSDAHSVVLDFTTGSFVAKNLQIDTDDAELNLQLQNWFISNPIQYLINTVVFNDATTLKSLQPTAFKLNVLTTNSNKNILQVFIATTGQLKSNLTINVNEPIPDGFHNSLMINTKILYQDIFVDSFNKGESNVQVASVDPKNDFSAWSAKVTSGTVSGEATFQNTSSSETRISASGNTITWPLEGLTFSATKDLGINLSYKVEKTVAFQHRTYNCYSSQYGSSCSWSNWRDHSVNVNVELSGNYPLSVDPKKQQVQISSQPPTVTVTPPDLKPDGPSECTDAALKKMVGDILKAQVPNKLRDSMAGIKFTAVSVFALYNLLFPADDFIVMQQAYVPGDLVVLGTFNKKYTS